MLKHRLQIAELIIIVGSIIAQIVAIATGQVFYAAVLVSIALLLNLLNRLRLEQQLRHRITGMINQWHRQVQQDNHAVIDQTLQAALADLPNQHLSDMTQSESPEVTQLKAQIVSLEQSLSSVVQYLNNSSLTARVEQLEKAIATLPTERPPISDQLPPSLASRIDRLERQLQSLNRPIIPSPQATAPPTSTVPDSAPHETPTVSISIPTWKELHSLTGHSDWIHALAISPNGQLLVSGSFDQTIKVWQLSTGNLVRTLTGHSQGVLSVAISPDGKTLASGGFDETIKLWRLNTGKLLHTLTGHTGSVRSLLILDDSQTLISGSFDKTIKLWGLNRRECLLTLTEQAGAVSAMAVTPDEQTLASGGNDGIISLRGLHPRGVNQKPLSTLTLSDNLSSINALAISPDGQRLVAGCIDGKVRVWHLSTSQPPDVLKGHMGPVISVVFSADAQLLISGSADGTIRIWHLNTGQSLGVLTTDSGNSVLSMAISPNGQLLAVGGADRMIKIWQHN